MANGVEVEGFEEMFKFLDNMILTDEKKSKALRKALRLPFNKSKNNAPVRTGKQKGSIKLSVRKDSKAGGYVGTIRVADFHALFTEFGTSKDKSHVGWFYERSINETTTQVLEIIKEETFKLK